MSRFSKSIFSSRLARRTLILFIFSALAPMVVLSVLTTEQVKELFHYQQKQELSRASKSFGLLVYERMRFLLLQSMIVRKELDAAEDLDQNLNIQREMRREFSEIILVDPLSESAPPWLSSYQSSYAKRINEQGVYGAMLIDESTSQIWLVLSLRGRGDKKVLALSPSADYLWADLRDYDLRKEFKVYSQRFHLLFESEASEPSSAAIGDEQARASWSIMYRGILGEDVWRVEVRALEQDSILDQEEFVRLIKLVTLLAILVAIFISVKVIRRSLQPIQALRTGIEHINANQFDRPVSIDSGDEFQLLGDTFNNMSTRLGRHIHALESLSKVDQLILNRLKIEDIVEVVVNEGMILLSAKAIHFFVENKKGNGFTLFSNLESDTHLQLSDSVLQRLHHPQGIRRLAELDLPADIAARINDLADLYTSVLWAGDEAKAVIIVEFADKPEGDLISIANSFAEHIAVALKNADWEQRLFEQAHFDLLTGLPNRYLFNDQLGHAIDQAQRSGQKLGILFVDIDGFKSANDVFGHDAGDKLLKIVAMRLSEQVDSGVVYRLGGDEFVIIYNCRETAAQKVVEETGVVAEKLRAAVVEPVVFEGKSPTYSVSIGIAIYPDDSESAEDLLKRADAAMYQAKHDGRNCYRYYSESFNHSSVERGKIVAELRQALVRDEFELYYQPKVDLRTGLMIGCEALIRWHHPERGFLGPYYFIPLAENYGMIEDIGRWVIRKAALQQVEWKAKGLNLGRVAINVSVVQLLSSSFCRDVMTILAETGCQGCDLEFEITETAYADDIDKFKDVLLDLQRSGIIFSVDDYGTGYSSLSLLLNLPVNKIKIDKTFIDNIESDRVSYAIVESTINLAKEMGLTVVAEGVETPGQLLMLIDARCDSVQGYLFSKPLSANEIEIIIDKQFPTDMS